MPKIILSESHDAKSFETGSIIHEGEFKKAKSWIDNQLKEAEDAMKKQGYSQEAQAKTITILGGRGSGKTSFMKSLMAVYQKEGDVELIELIDPTLIEEKGHPFLIILSELDKRVRDKLGQEDASRARRGASREASWEKALKQLAEGLPSLDPIGNNYTQWEDAEYVMDKGLRRVASARALAQSFHELLREALKILSKKAFLIALDDIDTDFLRGWPILETLRRYLQTPLLITLLSGDLRMYSKAIRKQQWKNFGKALLKNEGEEQGRMAEYDALVTDMEGQYLQKVLPSIYRIHLSSLQEKRQRPEGIQKVLVCPTVEKDTEMKKDTGEPIEHLYRGYLSKFFGVTNRSLQEPYLAFLLGLPLRSQIRLLASLASLAEQESHDTTPWLDILLSELYALGIDVDLIRSTPVRLSVEMIQYLQRRQLLDRAYLFQPSLQNATENAGLFALSATYACHSRQAPYLFFEYLIRIGLPYHLDSEGLLSDSKTDSSTYFSLQTLVEYALTQDPSLTEACGSITAYVQALEDRVSMERLGGLNLRALAQSRRQGDFYSIGRIDYELRRVDPLRRCVAYLPVLLCRAPRKQRSILSASFYQLLASIGELLKKYRLELNTRVNAEKGGGAEMERRIIYDSLKELGALCSYLMPSPRSAHPYRSRLKEDRELDDESSSAAEQLQGEPFLKELQLWLNDTPEIILSPQLVGRVVSRLQQGLYKVPQRDFGSWMHRCTVMFFNAILIESSIEADIDVMLNRSNVITDDRYFRENLGKFPDKESIPRLAEWLLRCPLLLVFLDDKAGLLYPGGDPVIPQSLHPYLLCGLLSGVLPSSTDRALFGPIDMSSSEMANRNKVFLLRHIVRRGEDISSLSHLARLPFVNWGEDNERIQRVREFYRYYRLHLRPKTTATVLNKREEDSSPASDRVDMSTMPKVNKNKRALLERIKREKVSIKEGDDLDSLPFVNWGVRQNKSMRKSAFLDFYRDSDPSDTGRN